MVLGFKNLLPYATKNCILCADIARINQVQRGFMDISGFRVFGRELAKYRRRLKKTDEEKTP